MLARRVLSTLCLPFHHKPERNTLAETAGIEPTTVLPATVFETA